MKAIYLAWLELRRFRGPWRRFAPAVLILIPLLYGALLLWSNWDPFGRMSAVPVAVVNSDRPADHNGEQVNAGEQFVQQLRTTDTFQWHFVDANTARSGLEEGRYYFTIQVPQDFSTRLANSTRSAPQRPAVLLTRNDANGHLAGIMADTARYELQNQINAAAYAAYARGLYGDLGEVRGKLGTASEISEQLVQGTQLSKQSTGALARGLTGVRDGTGRVSGGVRDIAGASAQLDQRLSSITEFTGRRLPATSEALLDTSGAAVRDLNTITGGTAAAQSQAGRSAGTLAQLANRHPELRGDPLYRSALDDARRLAATTTTVHDAATDALGSAADTQDRALALRDELEPLQQDVSDIDEPATRLRLGSAELTGGVNGLTHGVNTLVANIGVAQTSSGQLNDGARRLADQVRDSLDRMPPAGPTEVARASSELGTPSVVRATTLNSADVYGRGVAPLFFAIALWVFGLFAYLLFTPLNQRALGGRTNPLSVAIGGWLPAAALGVIGGLVLLGAMDLTLGLDPVDLPAAVGLTALGAAAFTAINHFLRAAFGAVGGLVSLALLLVQITASGGLYPLETAPAPIQAMHSALPMSYLVDGLRVAFTGGEQRHLIWDAIVLGGVLVGFLLITSLVVLRHRTWTIGRLHPQIEL
ncbi:YhgE/Pip domain-containing protein [Saccharopolyspora sp. NFXS83]|uniref:YhgE/Pip family protein n=1 Tax=Saccharopolyspora sp. NFXS83 TaxID=2993560 RepID=UPI00224B95BA|nr:YhgE/Pip domain-containing protein [Saccharopolyspora sp. NFXS83]MCX2733718.1 YhgE/Pip domain-containing protein [Saccharopolyspora sp. NFXS83]